MSGLNIYIDGNNLYRSAKELGFAYTKSFDSSILVTGDGDFGCLVEFLKENISTCVIVAPDKNKCSFLLRNKNTEIIFLNEQYHKFSTRV